MAQVTTDAQQTIDRWRDCLTEAWQGLPQAEHDIDQWNVIEQIDDVEEWRPKEDLAAHLRQLIASPAATKEQRQRYEQLERLRAS